MSFEERIHHKAKLQSDELTEKEDKVYKEKLDKTISISDIIASFKPIPDDTLPKQAFFQNTTAEKRRLPTILNIMNGHLLAHESVVEIFQQHRLGQTQLSALTIYSSDMTTPLYEDYYFLSIAERQSFLDPEACEHDLSENYSDQYFIGNRDKRIALKEASLSCEVDIWHDPKLQGSIFISDPLHQALKDHKLTRHFDFFPPCIITG